MNSNSPSDDSAATPPPVPSRSIKLLPQATRLISPLTAACDRIRPLAVLALIGGLILSPGVIGCRAKTAEKVATERISGYVDLDRTLETHNEALQNELARIESEKGLPVQLQAREDSISADLDLAALFAEAFESDWRRDSLTKSLDRIWPATGLNFGEGRSRAHRFVVSNQESRQQLLDALHRPNSAFKADFTQGLAADVRWLTSAQLLARLEAIEIDWQVGMEQGDQAIDDVAELLRLAVRLDAVPQLNARLLAGEVRRLAILGTQHIALSGTASVEGIERLHGLLVSQLEMWPSSRDCWIGERGLGLHVFEMVRQGDYLSLLDDQELGELEEKREVTDRALVVQRNADIDQQFYLETLRMLLDHIDQPYCERQEMWKERFEELDLRRGAPEFPRVSADILLIGFSTAQFQLARDRARCDAWRLGLAASLALPDVEPVLNQATGEMLTVDVLDDGQIEIKGVTPEDEYLQPRLPRLIQ